MKVVFHIHYFTEAGQSLKIVGKNAKLGKNRVVDAPFMVHEGDGHWRLEVTFYTPPKTCAYRYVVVGDEKRGRILHDERFHSDRVLTLNDQEEEVHIYDQWREPFRGAGVAIPVSSIRTENGMGIGEFTDLKLLADWAKACDLKLIQLLPVNDTTVNFKWTDSSPYSTISAFALHPIYLNIEQVGKLPKDLRKQYRNDCKTLNALPQVDYEKVIKKKWKYIYELYERYGKHIFAENDEFRDFFRENQNWLLSYAAFCALRNKYKTVDRSKWAKRYQEIKPFCGPETYTEKHYHDVYIHIFVQYHLHKQLSEASKYAKKKGVCLKGDVPIGVHRQGADVWSCPRFFNTDCQAGAPPDAFSKLGQCWGFPTYNWKKMEGNCNDYWWWEDRLKKMSKYFQVIRLDHILGFFRIWEIPYPANDALLGHFSPALPFSLEELKSRGIDFDYDRFCKPYSRTPASDEDFNKNNVLFIEDKNKKKHFHPRVAFHETQSYQDLDDGTKSALNAIYDDYFYHRHNEFWREGALKKLKALKSATNMMICGEDLGMVPACTPEVMKDLDILGMIVQRMPNDPNKKFVDLQNVPYLSVCSPSTHDISGIREWWEENPETTKEFFYQELHQQGDCPAVCEPYTAQLIIDQHLHSPSLWAIFPIQDLFAMDGNLRLENPKDERINDPTNSRHYWNYRFHHTVENMLTFDEFNQKIAAMIRASNRKQD